MIIRDTGSDAGSPPARNWDTHPVPDSAMEEANRMADAPPEDIALSDRQPKGDHNRRLALGLDIDTFAHEAGLTAHELREYEQTGPDHALDLEVARRVGDALERLEANPPPSQKVISGGPA